MSDEQTPAKRGRKPKISVSPRSDEATWSQDDILAKRLAGQPFGVKTSEIPLREPGKWALRVANSQASDSRHYDMINKLGYKRVSADMLAEGISPESIGWRLAEDGQTLVRGVRGDEVLYCMPKDVHRQIQMAKADANTKSLKSESAAKNDVANAAASALGSQAGEFLNTANIRIQDHRGSL